jgi:hypothetical protein
MQLNTTLWNLQLQSLKVRRDGYEEKGAAAFFKRWVDQRKNLDPQGLILLQQGATNDTMAHFEKGKHLAFNKLDLVHK